MKYLKIDTLDPKGVYGFTENAAKIKTNLETIRQLKEAIEERRGKSKTVFCIMPYGRWIIVYCGDLVNHENDVMHFFDYRVNVNSVASADIFTEKQLSHIAHAVAEHEKDFIPKMDIVELVLAEAPETIQSKNIYSCENDSNVLAKAEELGVLLGLQTMQTGETIKVVVTEQQQEYKGNMIVNLFAFMNFTGKKDDSGYGYIKLFNAGEDEENLQIFENILFKSGLKFDRVYYSQRFFKHQLN